MADLRRDSFNVRLLRAAGFGFASIAAAVLFYMAVAMLRDPASPLHRYRGEATPPHVFVRGTLRTVPEVALPPVCLVVRERYEKCGKSRCWQIHASMLTSHASVDVEWSSTPLPSRMSLSSRHVFEPRAPAYRGVDEARGEAWRELSRQSDGGFVGAPANSYDERIREACLDDGDRVFIEACVSPSDPEHLEPCPGFSRYGIIRGEPQWAMDDAADSVALRVSGAFLALLFALFAVARGSTPIVEGLEDRAAPHRRSLGPAWALLAVPPAAGLVAYLLTGLRDSTWAVARVGFATGIGVLALWLLFALGRLLLHSRTLAALEPVLATPRSLLAAARGTVELAVRARQRGDGVRAFLGDDAVAFSQIRIVERYRNGKNSSSRTLLHHRQGDELTVTDESGEGVLHLAPAVLDVERRKVTVEELPRRYAREGIVVERHAKHESYTVEEQVIRDGEALYVFGDVTELALRTDGLSYRSVKGSPTLGGAGRAPVLVYAGDERGLVAALEVRAREARVLAAVAASACVALAAALAGLAWL